MKIKRMHRDKLPIFVREPIRELRENINNGNPRVFNNDEGRLPNAHGNTYYEYDVGEARDGSRGRHRIVALVSDGDKLEALYYSNDHYGVEWTEITW